MDILGLVFRWLHIIPATLMVGGLVFYRFCLVSSSSEEPSLLDARDDVRKRWGKIVMFSTLCLLVSGLYNFYSKAKGYELGGEYLAACGIKFLLALAIFFFAAVLSGRSENAKKFRQRESLWLNITIAIALMVVLLAGFMKTNSTNAPKKIQQEARLMDGDATAWTSPK